MAHIFLAMTINYFRQKTFPLKKSLPLLATILSLGISSTSAFAQAASHAEDIVTFGGATSPKMQVTTCKTGMVLTYNGTTYSCVLNSPTKACPAGQALNNLDSLGGGGCVSLSSSASCTAPLVLAGVDTSTNPPTPNCVAGPVAVPNCPTGMVLTSNNGINFSCVHETEFFAIPTSTLTAYHAWCDEVTIQPAGPTPGVTEFSAYCVSACDRFCQAQVNTNGANFAGGFLAEHDGIIHTAGCECTM